VDWIFEPNIVEFFGIGRDNRLCLCRHSQPYTTNASG
jgi:hypothetical protein